MKTELQLPAKQWQQHWATLVLRQNSTVATKSQALTIINAKFTEIQQDRASRLAILHQQLLNPERPFQASKATLAEVLKHFLEESVWAKALITYIDTLSTTPEEGI